MMSLHQLFGQAPVFFLNASCRYPSDRGLVQTRDAEGRDLAVGWAADNRWRKQRNSYLPPISPEGLLLR
jgi:hypothetical protein